MTIYNRCWRDDVRGAKFCFLFGVSTSSIPYLDDWPVAYETKSLNWCQWRILNILWVILNWCLSLPDFVMSCLSVHYNSLSIWKLSLIWYNDIEVKILQFAIRVSRALVKQTLQGPYCARSWADKVLWFGRGNLGLRIVRCDFEIYHSQTWKRSNIKFSRVFAQRTRILRERLNIKTLRKRWIKLPKGRNFMFDVFNGKPLFKIHPIYFSELYLTPPTPTLTVSNWHILSQTIVASALIFWKLRMTKRKFPLNHPGKRLEPPPPDNPRSAARRAAQDLVWPNRWNSFHKAASLVSSHVFS